MGLLTEDRRHADVVLSSFPVPRASFCGSHWSMFDQSNLCTSKSVTEELMELGSPRENSHVKTEPINERRLETTSMLLELVREHSHSTMGVLQSNVLAMLTAVDFWNLPVFFFLPDEIDEGCTDGPSQELTDAAHLGVDDRLVVTAETFERMLGDVHNFELSTLLEKYTDHVHATEMAWQVATLEKSTPDVRENNRIRNAAGIAVLGERIYVADSSQHVIFCVDTRIDEISILCGIRGRPGFYDGPREIAKFRNPSGMAVRESSSTLYICDTGNDAIRAVSLPSGVVHTLSLSIEDPDVRLSAPVGICVVTCDCEDDGDDNDGDDDDGDAQSRASDCSQNMDEEDEADCLGWPRLFGINEEDDDFAHDLSPRSSIAGMMSWSEVGAVRKNSSQHNARYTLSDRVPLKPSRLSIPWRSQARASDSARVSTGCWSSSTSRRTSGYTSSMTSRRTSAQTSGFCSSLSSASSRRTSMYTMTPGESVKTSLRECTDEDERRAVNLAVTCDHSVFLLRPEKGDMFVLAGSPSEYGYRDAEKGSAARFSSLKGVVCIRNCLFVADHWNNAIRCVNLKTRQVDSVVDFNPCGPVGLTVSGAGSVYVLDSECVSVCNILKICSLQRSPKDTESELGTTMFQLIQDSIGRSRSGSVSSSQRSSLQKNDWQFIEGLSRRGSAKDSRRKSTDSSSLEKDTVGGSRRASREGSRRQSVNLAYCVARHSAGAIASLGPRADRFTGTCLELPHGAMATNLPAVPLMESASLACGRRPSDASPSLSLPVIPKVLRSLVPGASLHPALIQMTLRGHSEAKSVRNSAVSGSQLHISVLSSALDENDFDETPEFFSHLNPKHQSPWTRLPIGTLQYVYQESVGQPTSTTPLALACLDVTDETVSTSTWNFRSQQLMVGGSDFPAVLKLLPPRKGAPNVRGRFRAVAVDKDRIIIADCDSNSVFVVNHAECTKKRIAGCGKVGYLDGPLDVCRMNGPSSVALDPTTHYIYVADTGNHRVRCIDVATGFMRNVCGNGVKGHHNGNELKTQSLDSPLDVRFMSPHHLIVSCADNSIRRLDLQTSMLETVLVGS